MIGNIIIVVCWVGGGGEELGIFLLLGLRVDWCKKVIVIFLFI